MTRLFLVLLATGLIVAGPAGSRPLSEADYLSPKLAPVLTGSRLKQKRANVPASVTVIDRQMIEASGARDIPRLLRLVPGMIVGHEGDRIGVAYHGNTDIYSRRLQVLVDGRSVYTPTVGGMEWYEFPVAIEDIERIEVIRGPNGAAYGSNSFSAVINIITRHPLTAQGIMARVEGGEGRYRRAVVRHGGVRGPLSWRMTAVEQSSAGFRGRLDDNRRYLFDLRSEYRLPAASRFEFSLGATGGIHGKGGGSSTDPYRNAHKRANYQYLRWVRDFGAGEELSLRFYRNFHRESDTYPVLISGVLPYTFSLGMQMERLNLELQHSRRLSRDFRLVWGVELRRDHVRGEVDFGLFGNNRITNGLERLYVNAEYIPHPAWVVNAGMMYEHSDFVGGDVSPRLALNYHINRHHTLRFIHSRAIRIPAALEDSADAVVRITTPALTDIRIVGNRNLRPEQVRSSEIGYFGRLWRGRLTVDMRLFRERIRDIISFYTDEQNYTDSVDNAAKTFINDGFTNISGWEFHADYRPSRGFRMVLGFSRVRSSGRIREHLYSNGSKRYFDLGRSMPGRVWSLLLSRRLARRASISATFYRFTPVEWSGGDNTGNVSTLDLRYAKRFRQGRGNGKLEVIVQDAAGRYIDFDNDFVFRPRLLISYTYRY